MAVGEWREWGPGAPWTHWRSSSALGGSLVTVPPPLGWSQGHPWSPTYIQSQSGLSKRTIALMIMASTEMTGKKLGPLRGCVVPWEGSPDWGMARH